mmetsp:Transcript_112467/g.328779  ORF Transcript_112467/g.328779 Transcript_112467/m.328779 type:complete len:262 (-) Transcript_112467:284-1069(-)
MTHSETSMSRSKKAGPTPRNNGTELISEGQSAPVADSTSRLTSCGKRCRTFKTSEAGISATMQMRSARMAGEGRRVSPRTTSAFTAEFSVKRLLPLPLFEGSWKRPRALCSTTALPLRRMQRLRPPGPSSLTKPPLWTKRMRKNLLTCERKSWPQDLKSGTRARSCPSDAFSHETATLSKCCTSPGNCSRPFCSTQRCKTWRTVISTAVTVARALSTTSSSRCSPKAAPRFKLTCELSLLPCTMTMPPQMMYRLSSSEPSR